MSNVVAVYNPGALVGVKLRECCKCPCHTSCAMHFTACCVSLKDFKGFPELDEFHRPIEKLLNCPNCNEDELVVICSNEVLCHVCGWKMVRGYLVGITS